MTSRNFDQSLSGGVVDVGGHGTSIGYHGSLCTPLEGVSRADTDGSRSSLDYT